MKVVQIISIYLLLGMLWTMFISRLSENHDEVKFDAAETIGSILIWPICIYVFVKSIIKNLNNDNHK